MTPETTIHCPDSIRGGRDPWTGTLAELFDYAPAGRVGALVAAMEEDGRIPRLAEDQDDERWVADLAPLMTLDDVRRLADDPNAVVVG